MVEKSFKPAITVRELMRTAPSKKGLKGWQPNMQLALLRNNPIVQDWMKGYPQSTQTTYTSNFNQFLNITGKTPKQLLKMSAQELKKLAKGAAGELVADGKMNPAKNVLKTVKSFGEHYDKKFYLSHGEKIRVGKIKTEYVPKPEEIYAIAEAASNSGNPVCPRNGAMILFDWVTALRKNALANIRCGAVMGYSEGDCPIPLRIGNKSQTIGSQNVWCIDTKMSSYGIDYTYTFVHKAGFVAVQQWLEWRKRKIGSYDKKDILFCQVKHVDPTKDIRHLGHPNIWQTYKRAVGIVASNSANPYLDPQNTSLHQLRDAFKSAMIHADVDPDVQEAMMAHRIAGSKANYFDNHDVELAREQYSKADFTRDGKSRIKKMEEKMSKLDMQHSLISMLQQQMMTLQDEVYRLRSQQQNATVTAKPAATKNGLLS